jgi:hypothetical protein
VAEVAVPEDATVTETARPIMVRGSITPTAPLVPKLIIAGALSINTVPAARVVPDCGKVTAEALTVMPAAVLVTKVSAAVVALALATMFVAEAVAGT